MMRPTEELLLAAGVLLGLFILGFLWVLRDDARAEESQRLAAKRPIKRRYEEPDED